jgi:hypothetical protein
MRWSISPRVQLDNVKVSSADTARQHRTAAEILRRLGDQPGVVLADEVGMGKTFVALAVAVSVIEATEGRQPVVVMVPPAVADKWPKEWAVFSELCMSTSGSGRQIRASEPVRRGSDFLKLLDDPADRRKHLIFVTHGALSTNLHDPFVRLALLRAALHGRHNVEKTRRAIAKFSADLLLDKQFTAPVTEALLASPTNAWQSIFNRMRPDRPLDDDPVPLMLERALTKIDLGPLREAAMAIPRNKSANFEVRMKCARRNLNKALNHSWSAVLGTLKQRLPLLILDEAHHLKNPNKLAQLFANDGSVAEDVDNIDVEHGPLGDMFSKMLFLTATPFQLGHQELLSVLDRFHGVRWDSKGERERFDDQLASLRSALDRAQATSLRFERAWSHIDPATALTLAGRTSFDPATDDGGAVQTAMVVGSEALKDARSAQLLLRPWVIRHVRPNASERRCYWEGRAILDDVASDRGLPISTGATLPFLLATRAQALAALGDDDDKRAARPLYAYGLASSFEAYRDTRANTLDADAETQLDGADSPMASPQLRWYLEQISRSLPTGRDETSSKHPKVSATVGRVSELWRSGEKVLIFCFYRETGRALRAHISRELRTLVFDSARSKLELRSADDSVVSEHLDRIGDRLLRIDSPGYGNFKERVGSLAGSLPTEQREQVVEIVARFMRTPTFLTRFVDLAPDVGVDELMAAFDKPDGSGLTLAGRISRFVAGVEGMVDVERDEVFDALATLQTGAIGATITDIRDDLRDDGLSGGREMLMPTVRLANGTVDRETRRRLMLAFNSPFFPEVLIASSVLAEGVDLHVDCRYVIHHDLDWNPSTLEQRTGRVDRIGSKAEMTGKPVVVYEPYVDGTHDEKMFRVVKDRERWFGIVMGGGSGSDELATADEETRVPLPPALATLLTMDLSL